MPNPSPNQDLLPRSKPPTKAQHDWLKAHPGFVRISHLRAAKTIERGTLLDDGTFRAEGPGQPLMDGNGAFSVARIVAPHKGRH
jgi:hypothetical protein